MKTILLVAALVLPQMSWAGPNHPPVEVPKEFETVKKLVGHWEGKGKMGGEKEETVSAVYELTSGGTAVTEKLNPGTPHEMVSVYHKDGKSVAMTHYCAMGNQPHMKLKKATATQVAFEMTKPVGITSAKEPHMHAVTLTLENPDTLKQEWTNFAEGKKQGTVTFVLQRKK